MPASLSSTHCDPLIKATWYGSVIQLFFAGLLLTLIVGPLAVFVQHLPDDLADPAHWRRYLLATTNQRIILQSIMIALLATGIASLLSLPVAFVAGRARPLTRRLLLVLGTTPLIVPTALWAELAQALSTQLPAMFFADQLGQPIVLLIVIYAWHLSPIMLLTVTAALTRADPSQTETARCHGISPLVAWYRMTLPQLTPAYVLAATVIAVLILTDSAAPRALGIEGLLTTQALAWADEGSKSPDAMSAFTVLVVLNATLVALSYRYLIASPLIAAPRRPESHTVRHWSTAPAIAIATTLAVGPLAALALLSDLHHPTLDAMVDSYGWPEPFAVALMASLVLAGLGLPVALVAKRNEAAARLVRWMLPFTLVTPSSLLAWLYVDGLHVSPPLGLSSLGVSFPSAAAALAAGIAIVLPLLALIPHLTRHLALLPDPAQIELARYTRTRRRSTVSGMLLPGRFGLVIALAMLGLALGIADTSTAHLVARTSAGSFLAENGMRLSAEGSARVVVLLGCTAVLALGAGLLLRRRRDDSATIGGA